MTPTQKDTPAQEPVKEGEHIFNATRLTALAIEWQKHNAAGEHEKALELLEEIVKGSTVMFERFAQFEGFDSTVDLPTLVLAAQEKIVKWLIAWRPEKGKLFSWFSKSLTGSNLLTCADGKKLRISEIVDNRLDVCVLSVNEVTGKIEPKRVIDWIKAPAFNGIDEWSKLSVEHPSGFYRCIWVTWDHPMLTQRGWIEVKYLDPGIDRLRMLSPVLSNEGVEALIGMRLGDGHFCARPQSRPWKTYFCLGHSNKQEEYAKRVAGCFRKALTYFDADDGTGKKHKSNRFGISLSSICEEHSQFPRRKGLVTDWMLQRMSSRSLAYWWMDDGCSQKAVLCANAFKPTEVAKLQACLDGKFGLKSEWKKRSKAEYGDICISDEHRFFSIISQFVVPEMRWKLPEQYRDTEFSDARDDIFIQDKLVTCNWKVRKCRGKANVQKTRDSTQYPGETYYPCGMFTPDFTVKYDVTVEDNFNFLVEGVVAHNCAKNVFKGEVVRANTYRTRIYSTGDSLEKFHGAEDHEAFRDEVEVSVRDQFKRIAVRWGSKQEIGAVRFLLESIMLEDHDKRCAVQSARYGFGLSLDLSKFFYNWVLFAMRNELYVKAHVPFTEQDLVRHSNSYTHIPDLLEIITWVQFKRIVMTLGGQRIKIPTSQQLSKLKDNYDLYVELEASDKDPASVETLARRRGRTTKSAQDVWDEMSTTVRPDRSGEYPVYE
jgi:hypothetical protein